MDKVFTIGSKNWVENYTPQRKAILVRVFSSEPYDYTVDLSDEYLDILKLVFDDIDITPDSGFWNMFNMNEEAKGLIPVNMDHIQEFISFIDKWEEAEEVVIHCDAGMSRSPALAIGICHLKGWEKEELRLRRIYRRPNDAVLDLFCKLIEDRDKQSNSTS